MKGGGEWKSKKGKKGQGRSELGKTEREGGMDKGGERLRRKRRKMYVREGGHSPLIGSFRKDACSVSLLQEGVPIIHGGNITLI